MQSQGLDSSVSWTMACASLVVNLLVMAPARVSGVLFVAFMEMFAVDRKQASLPFTLFFTLRTLTGPLAGFLGECFGLRRMSIMGCVFTALGVAACFLAQDMIMTTILLGGLYGLGYGVVCSLLPEFLNQHFEKHLSKANGLTMGGSGLGAFLMPPIIVVLTATYGVSGMLLLFGGLLLHCIPAAMILREAKKPLIEENNAGNRIYPHPKKDEGKQHNSALEDFSCNLSFEASVSAQKEMLICDSCIKKYYDVSLTSEKSKLHFIPCIHFMNHAGSGSTWNVARDTDLNFTQVNNGKSIPFPEEKPLPCRNSSLNGSLVKKTFTHKGVLSTDDTLLLTTPPLRQKRIYTINLVNEELKSASRNNKGPSTALHSFRVFVDPAFILMMVTQGSYYFMTFLMWTIIVDLVRDKEFHPDDQVYFAMCLPLSDTLGRLVLGFIPDSGLLTKSNFSAVCFLGMGMSAVALPFVRSFATTMSAVIVYGLMSGGNIIVLPGMVRQFIDKDLRTMAMASRAILNTPLSMAFFPLMGYYRENYGSHEIIIYIVASISIACSVISWITPDVAKYRDNRRKNKVQKN